MQDLTINAVGAQGDGLSRTEDGKPAFVPLTLPGERVRATMDGARGEVEAILAASPDRIVPSCKHFGTCGGCALQHWAAQPYLAWKAEQIRIQLSMGGLETEILPTFASPPASRRRVALHARKGGKGQGARLGFKERRSWNLTPIEECPVTDPRIIAALPALARLAEPFLEHPKSAPTLHVTLTGTGLDIDVTGVERKSGGLSADARMRAAMAAGEGDFARVTLAGETVYGARQPLVKLGQAVVALPPRAGAAEQTVEIAKSKVGKVVGVSCNPATFAKDARVLVDAGFRLEKVAPVDQFVWSPHIELVGVFTR